MSKSSNSFHTFLLILKAYYIKLPGVRSRKIIVLRSVFWRISVENGMWVFDCLGSNVFGGWEGFGLKLEGDFWAKNGGGFLWGDLGHP
ncbi:MAG: hypothetical protein ACYS9Y_13535 [Planctomycetota bacterium]|jgi:hypothetical protein